MNSLNFKGTQSLNKRLFPREGEVGVYISSHCNLNVVPTVDLNSALAELAKTTEAIQ